MTVIRISCLAFVVSCATSPAGPNDDPDLDADAELAAILADPMPDLPTFDADTAETQIAATACTKERYLHVANYSYVGALGCANGVCSNGCWGYQRRTSGFACDYAGSQADFVETRIGENNGPFASYNEIKPLNAHDAAAVANCRAQSGGLPVRTYTVWNGTGWNAEGIPADVKFAEVFGRQSEAAPHFWTWFANARGSFSPMANVSPETGITFVGTKETVARLCSATRTEWMSVYFYDPQAAGGSGMADWKREAIIRGMNYCTSH
jgi:hypothetical protein